MPPMATFSELLRAALRTSTAAVSEGSRRNASSAIQARQQDGEAATQLLAALAPTAAGLSGGHRRPA
jgi:hypothetical protein